MSPSGFGRIARAVLIAAALVCGLILGLAVSPVLSTPVGTQATPGPTTSAWTVIGPRQVVLTPGSSGAPSLVRVFQPSVLRALNGSYLIFYTGYDGFQNHLLEAWSPDGIAWTSVGEVVFLYNGCGSPFAMVVDGVYHLWFESVQWGVGPLGYLDQIYLVTSSDGLHWSAPALALPSGSPSAWDGGSVADPSVARDASGTYRMYFTMYAANGSVVIGVATSSDLVNWTKWAGNPVLLPGPAGTWDDAALSNPSVVSGSSWTLFFQGRQATTKDQIGIATSTDGYTWVRSAAPFLAHGAAGTWDSLAVGGESFFGGATNPRLYFDGDDGTGANRIGMVLLEDVLSGAPGATAWSVTGNGYQDGGMDRMGLATNGSLALGPFVPPTNRTMVLDVGPAYSADSADLYSESVLHESTGTYKMYYTGYDGGVNRILLATSPDGVAWTKQGVVLAPSPSGASPYVVKIGSTYHMWYEITASGGPLGWNNQIYHATSSDGVNWTAQGLALGLGANDTWDAASVSDPHVVADGSGLYRMYYTGTDTLQDAQIGVATSSNLVNWTRYSNIPVVPFGSGAAWDNAHVAYPSVSLVGSAWVMYYYAFPNASAASIGRASSSDGYNWSKDASNPFLVHEASPSWDSRSVAMPDFLMDPSGPRLYYRGDDGTTSRIGVYSFSPPPPVSYSGHYFSPIFDSGTNGTRWSALGWNGNAPAGSTLSIAVRAGTTPIPDAGWTTWTNLTSPGASQPPFENALSLPRDRFLQLQVSMTSDNWSVVPWAQSVNVTYASDGAPAATLVAPSSGAWTNASRPVLRWTAADPEGDPILASQVQLSAASDFATILAASGNLTGGTASWQVPSALAEGSWYWRVRAEDAFGTWGSWASASFQIDVTPPLLQVASPTPGMILRSHSLDVVWLAQDNGSGLGDAQVSLDGGVPVVVTPGNLSAHLTGIADGEHTITVRAWDQAGNSQGVTITVIVDTTSPSVVITNPTPGAVVPSASLQVAWTATDSGSGIDRIQVSVDGGSPMPLSPVTSEVNLTGLSDGVHTIVVIVYDLAGNAQSATTSVIVDTTSPSVVITDPTSGAHVPSHSLEVTWNVMDSGSGIDRIQVSVDGGTPIVLSADASSVNLTGLGDGAHTITVTVYDRAGNARSATTSVTVDTNLLSLTGPDGPWPLVALVLAIVAAVGVGAYVVFRTRRRENPPAP